MVQFYFMMRIPDDQRANVVRQLTYRDEPVETLDVPSWWHGDEEASVSSTAALGELMRGART